MNAATDALDAAVEAAIARLQRLTPLLARQTALPADLYDVHHPILSCLLQNGRMPALQELSQVTQVTAVADALQRLARDDLIILDSHDALTGANPLTLEQTPHRVEWLNHSMCAHRAHRRRARRL